MYLCPYCKGTIALVVPTKEPPREAGIKYNLLAKSSECYYECTECKRQYIERAKVPIEEQEEIVVVIPNETKGFVGLI